MSSESNSVCGLIRDLLPWLNMQLSNSFDWLGAPENPGYESACRSARSINKPLDGEIQGEKSCIAIEHTRIQPFPSLLHARSVLRPLYQLARELCQYVPNGNRIDFGLKVGSQNRVTAKSVNLALSGLREYFQDWFGKMQVNPTAGDRIRANLLEEPCGKTLGGLEFSFRRSFWPGRGKLSFGADAEPELDSCVQKAMEDKVTGKVGTFGAYRKDGWRTMLLLELVDFQLASIDDVGESFNRFAARMDLSPLDFVVIVDRSAGDPMECCFAWKDGRLRTEKERYEEVHDCLNPARPSNQSEAGRIPIPM
jgi:hypothetical protein